MSLLTHVGGMATACVGAWRALGTGQMWASLQVMAFAWAVIFVTALVFLFGDGSGKGSPSPPPLPSRLSPRSEANAEPAQEASDDDAASD